MFQRKRKHRKKQPNKSGYDRYPFIYGYGDNTPVVSYPAPKKKKKNKIKKHMGFTPSQLEEFCNSIPITKNIKTILLN